MLEAVLKSNKRALGRPSTAWQAHQIATGQVQCEPGAPRMAGFHQAMATECQPQGQSLPAAFCWRHLELDVNEGHASKARDLLLRQLAGRGAQMVAACLCPALPRHVHLLHGASQQEWLRPLVLNQSQGYALPQCASCTDGIPTCDACSLILVEA